MNDAPRRHTPRVMFGLKYNVSWTANGIGLQLPADPGFDWFGIGLVVLATMVFAAAAMAEDIAAYEPPGPYIDVAVCDDCSDQTDADAAPQECYCSKHDLGYFPDEPAVVSDASTSRTAHAGQEFRQYRKRGSGAGWVGLGLLHTLFGSLGLAVCGLLLRWRDLHRHRPVCVGLTGLSLSIDGTQFPRHTLASCLAQRGRIEVRRYNRRWVWKSRSLQPIPAHLVAVLAQAPLEAIDRSTWLEAKDLVERALAWVE